ncbi:MAG: MBL fold metallo-hydrolase [Xanthobacteraceae bacterium]|jgi:glyoxylase-like metal-dependent hydrolase (beta-lactamase superfamily II)
MSGISRRDLLASSAIAAAAAPSGWHAALAAAPASSTQASGFYRYRVGDYEMTAINDGVWLRTIDDKFVSNVPYQDVQKALADSFQPVDKLPIPFTSLVVNTGSKLVLIDAGTGGQLTQLAPQSGTWDANFAAAGFDPKNVDTILISHFHQDHINGLKSKDGALRFPNAEIRVSSPEWAFWMDDAQLSAAPESIRPVFLNARRIFADIAKDVKRFEPGDEVAPGIRSIAAYGHTPGHVAFAITSGDASMLALSDTSHNPWLFVRHPEWQAIVDTDAALAAETRKKMLDRAAADRMLVQGYHFPFPASGHIRQTATGYDLIPVMWQASL